MNVLLSKTTFGLDLKLPSEYDVGLTLALSFSVRIYALQRPSCLFVILLLTVFWPHLCFYNYHFHERNLL